MKHEFKMRRSKLMNGWWKKVGPTLTRGMKLAGGPRLQGMNQIWNYLSLNLHQNFFDGFFEKK
ncbi:hypothetical protein HanIR_Chr09g0432671 [Helianthus annuus]|nr:hypothetical protein HanIR_Chr09g0432671 [Helianthus annuus]